MARAVAHFLVAPLHSSTCRRGNRSDAAKLVRSGCSLQPTATRVGRRPGRGRRRPGRVHRRPARERRGDGCGHQRPGPAHRRCGRAGQRLARVRPGRPGRDPAPRCVGPARSGPPATPVRPPEPAPRPPGPGVVQRLGRDPLTLDVLDELLGDLGQLARRRPRPPPQLVERLVQRDPFGGRHHPFGLLDPDPAGQRLPQLGHLDLVVG